MASYLWYWQLHFTEYCPHWNSCRKPPKMSSWDYKVILLNRVRLGWIKFTLDIWLSGTIAKKTHILFSLNQLSVCNQVFCFEYCWIMQSLQKAFVSQWIITIASSTKDQTFLWKTSNTLLEPMFLYEKKTSVLIIKMLVSERKSEVKGYLILCILFLPSLRKYCFIWTVCNNVQNNPLCINLASKKKSLKNWTVVLTRWVRCCLPVQVAILVPDPTAKAVIKGAAQVASLWI